MLKILIAGQGPSYRTKVKAALEQKAFKYVEADTGKETQLKIYAEKYLAILLDIDIRDHSFIYVIKYIQFNSPSMKIILTCQSKSQLNDMGLTVEEIKELGVADLIYAHFSAQQILNSIEGQVQFSSWRLIEKNETSSSPTEEVSPDSEFTKIPIANFFSGNATIFDLFLKLSSGRYLKIMNKGDFFEPEKIKQYKEEKKIDYLYFKTKDRVVYINFLSVLLEKLVLKPKVDSKFKLNLTQHLTEKFLEEAFVRGLNPQLFDDGNRVCSVIYNMVMQQKNLSKMVSSLEESIDSEFNHSFLLSFYASIICNQLNWKSRKTIDNVIWGGMFHDIGMLKLPKSLQNVSPEDMSPEEKKYYHLHPQLGLDMLGKFPEFTTQAKLIILEHHETKDGTGFPRGISGGKIFPLAQIIGLCDYFAIELKKKKILPNDLVSNMANDLRLLDKYDHEIILALKNSFK